MRKNVAGQKWRVFAFNRLTSMPVIGDSAQITAKISIDYGTRNPSADTNPTEAEDGYYYFDLSQAETNGSIVEIFPESVTANVQVIGVPGRELPASAVPLTGGSSDPNNLFIYEAGQTDLYAFPASDDYPFSGWNTHRVLCTELIPGLYRAMIDPDKSTLWSVFDGAAAPSTHDAAIATVSVGGVGGDATLSKQNEILGKLGQIRGPGDTSWSIELKTSAGVAISGCECWIATDSAGNNVITDIQTTNANGIVEFLLDPGDYYLFRRKTGYTFTNPQPFTVT